MPCGQVVGLVKEIIPMSELLTGIIWDARVIAGTLHELTGGGMG